MRGPTTAPTLALYGDYECPYTRLAYRSVERIERDAPGLVRLAFRHFPLTAVHPHALACAEAVEAAHAQGRFWDLHDLLFHRQKALARDDLLRYASELGLDVPRFERELDSRVHEGRVEEDLQEGLAHGVAGTPALFLDGERYEASYAPEDLGRALEAARA